MEFLAPKGWGLPAWLWVVGTIWRLEQVCWCEERRQGVRGMWDMLDLFGRMWRICLVHDNLGEGERDGDWVLLKQVWCWTGLRFGLGQGLWYGLDWIWLRVYLGLISHNAFDISRVDLTSWYHRCSIATESLKNACFCSVFYSFVPETHKNTNQGYPYCIWPFSVFLRIKVGIKWWVFAYSSTGNDHNLFLCILSLVDSW